MCAIHYAAFNGDLNLIKELIVNGGDIQQRNNVGMNALHFAAQGNHASVIVYLIDEHGFNINDPDGEK